VVEELAKTHRFTVEEFHKMGEAGIFSEDDRVELVEGEIVEMAPIGWRHMEAVNDLARLLFGLAGGRYTVSVQNPLVVGEHGEHYPDLVLYRAGVRGRVPEAGDALVVIEVADTTVSYDRNVKLPLYARAGVPEAWLVDLRAGVVEVHSEPREGGYGLRRRYARGEGMRSAILVEITFEVDEALPAP
jgi:Uma2 family endonuclease